MLILVRGSRLLLIRPAKHRLSEALNPKTPHFFLDDRP